VRALSRPVLTGPNAVPIGLQIFAHRHDDRALFAWARRAYRVLAT
jgi:Asp-tRNA(Asn)/Glu-tRNA(Gln) amidotransferase A subunit family amidase